MVTEQQNVIITWRPADKLKPHPLNTDIYGDDGFQDLIPSIKQLGILQAVYIRKDNTLISGHRRWRAALEIDKTYPIPTIEVNFPTELDEAEGIIEHNRYRIKNGQQLYNEGKRLEAIEAERAREREYAGKKIDPEENFPQGKRAPQARDNVAKKIGLGSGKQWDKLGFIAKHNPNLLSEIKPDGYSIHKAFTHAKVVASLEPDDQQEVLALVRKGEAKNVIVARRQVQRINASKIKPPTGKYQVIYADPPWEYEFGFDIHGAASRHYNTMTVDEICNYPIPADDNAVLFLWVTSPKLREGLKVIEAWGFDYKTSFLWDKVKHVMGHYNSLRHEFLLIAVKGSYPKQSNTLRDSVITIERNNHSEKPEEFRQLIDEMYPQVTKIEIFNPSEMLPPPNWVFHGRRT